MSRREKRPAGTAAEGVSAEFLDLLETYLTERINRRTMMPTTARVARYQLYHLGRALGDRPISDMDRTTAEAFMDAISGRAPQTIRHSLSSARAFIGWLIDREILRDDPTRHIAKPRLPRYMPRALTAREVKAVFEACATPRMALIVSLMVNEGLRCVEVSRLEMGDLDLHDRLLHVTGKGLHERVLPITDETWSLLRQYLAARDIYAGPLIRSEGTVGGPGLTAQRISELVAATMRDAGIKGKRHDGKSAHALRHTAATDMLRNGAHVRDVQNVLGHANLQSTQRYMPLVVGDLRTAMNGRSYRFPELRGQR